MKQEPSVGNETDSYYKSLDQHTTLLTPQDATVFLSASSLQLGVKAARPYLEWSFNGTTKVIKLEKFPLYWGDQVQELIMDLRSLVYPDCIPN